MAIIAKAKKDHEYIPAPEGFWSAVCVDVVDLGDVEMEWKGNVRKVHRVRIHWQIPETFEYKDPETKEVKNVRFTVVKNYTLSLHKKADLRKDLEAWRGRAFSDDQLNNGFDLEQLIGINCQIGIIHKETDTATYANLSTIAPPAKGMEVMVPLDYVRAKDRVQKNESNAVPISESEESADDLPF